MRQKLHIDIETYSSVDIKTAGAYKYTESIDFEILLISYAFDGEPIKIVDLCQGEEIPQEFIEGLLDPEVEKHAHNATFERLSFKAWGYDTPIEQWHCSAIKSSYCGLPLRLEDVSKALKLEEKGKLSTGKALINYFCKPCKPTKTNGQRVRNLPEHHPTKWEEFRKYCINDTEAEREIDRLLADYVIPDDERFNYIVDQEINDRGILLDLQLAKKAQEFDTIYSDALKQRVKDITGVENPNSLAQLKAWLSEAIGEEVTKLAKDTIPDLLAKAKTEDVKEVLDCRTKLGKTSVKKYAAMEACVCDDGRAHGLFQFCGAGRTGRWAGRLIQLQNLPQNHISDLDLARRVIRDEDYDTASLYFDSIPKILSELIRTALVAKPGHTFAVADYSAIEARVIAWLAGEKWRIDVFNSHGKIYEASASMMFGVPIESVTKGSDLRQKGKIAELALGYQGGVGALKTMGGEKMGLSEIEMSNIVKRWRAANPNIKSLWQEVDNSARRALVTRKPVALKNLVFEYDGRVLTIKLPSGRKLFYQNPYIAPNRFDNDAIHYWGMNQTTKKWERVETYGGKLVENIVQAISRDLLAYAMRSLRADGFDIVMHVHDEAVTEIPLSGQNPKLSESGIVGTSEEILAHMCRIMAEPVPWAEGLPLNADGYLTPYYKKD